MLLGIDIGNTNAVIGLFREGELIRQWRVATDTRKTPDEFSLKVNSFLQLETVSIQDVQAVMISSVMPDLSSNLESVFPRLKFYLVDHKFPFSFSNQTLEPSKVGTDRLVNAEAVVREQGGPAVIVDLGTATTICALNDRKEFLGGAIVPGVMTAYGALARGTAQLPDIEMIAPTTVIGPDSQSAIQSGALHGHAMMVDGMVRRFKEEMALPEAKVIATGGWSTRIGELSSEVQVVDPNLTLKGIGYLYESICRI